MDIAGTQLATTTVVVAHATETTTIVVLKKVVTPLELLTTRCNFARSTSANTVKILIGHKPCVLKEHVAVTTALDIKQFLHSTEKRLNLRTTLQKKNARQELSLYGKKDTPCNTFNKGRGAVYYVGLIIWITDVTRNRRTF